MTTTAALQLRVHSITYEATDIFSFELRSPGGAELPPFTAGAHIDLQLPGGLVRSYSLVNPQHERHRYRIAVNRDAGSRGGSRYMHDALKVGAIVAVTPPRNNFALFEGAAESVLIAGGIGITPILCMIERLSELGRRWTLHYCARTRQNAAFLDRLGELQPAGTLHLNFDHGQPANMLDIASVVAAVPADAHLYCCGPVPMLEAFERACTQVPSERVHVEYFAAKEAPAAEGGFVVELARSNRTIPIARGQTILEALLAAGIDAPYSCMEGVCATCETKVLAGIPDHKDLVLTKEEKAANQTMMICCSGSKTDKLVLDL
jgi:ferredoxin-NADP reductase